MKIDLVRTIVAICIGALLGWGFYAMAQDSMNGQQAGPFNMNQLQQMVQQGQLTPQTYVWKQGMAGWELASNVPELGSLFQSTATPPPPPPMP